MAIEAHRLGKEYVFAGSGTPGELLSELQLIPPFAAKVAARSTLLRWCALGVLILFLVLAIATATGVLALAGVIAAIGFFAKSFFTQTLQLERVELLRLILGTLSHDAGSRGRLAVFLRLRVEKQQLSAAPDPKYKGGKQVLLQDAWLTLQGRLSDGTNLNQSLTDLIRQRTRTNRRGKTKTKERSVSLLRLRLAYDPVIYGDAALAASRLHNPFRLPEGTQVKAMKSTAGSLNIKTLVQGDHAPANLHASMEAVLLGAYRILNLARRRAGGGKIVK